MIEEVCFFKYLILRDSYFHRKLSCVKINITLEFSSSGNHSSHRREENSMKEMHILELSKLGHTEDILKEVVENHKRQEKILFSLASCHPCRIPFFKPCCEKPHQYRNQIIHKDKYISKPGFLKQKGPNCCQYI